MDEEGHVCLTDFGTAKLLDDDQVATSIVGTPEYLGSTKSKSLYL